MKLQSHNTSNSRQKNISLLKYCAKEWKRFSIKIEKTNISAQFLVTNIVASNEAMGILKTFNKF